MMRFTNDVYRRELSPDFDPYDRFFAEANERFRRRQTSQRLLIGSVLVLLVVIAGVRWAKEYGLES